MSKTVEQQVFEQHQKIIAVAQSGNNAKITLGEFLLWMREGDRYKFVAGEESTWTSYLASPEVKLPYSTAARYMTIAQVYIKDLGLTYDELNGLDTWALEYCSKVVNKRNVQKWLREIKELSRSDIKQLVKFGDTDQISCKHPHKEILPARERCKDCGAVMTKRDTK